MITLKTDPEGHATCGDMNHLFPVSALATNVIISQREITSQ